MTGEDKRVMPPQTFESESTLLRVHRCPTEECNGPNRPPTTGEDKLATLRLKFATRLRVPTRGRRALVRVRPGIVRSGSLRRATVTRTGRVTND